MEQYALLREKARSGEQANAALLESMRMVHTENSEDLAPASEWDYTIEQVQHLLKAPIEEEIGLNEDERTYNKAVGGKKRGDSALIDHLNQKTAKHSKRSRTEDAHPRELGGVPISDRNARFNRH